MGGGDGMDVIHQPIDFSFFFSLYSSARACDEEGPWLKFDG